MITYFKKILIVALMVFLLSGCIGNEVQEEGYVLAVSSTETKDGLNWIELRMDCKRTNCSRERFYFNNDENKTTLINRAEAALGSNQKVHIRYKDYFFFNNLFYISTVSFF